MKQDQCFSSCNAEDLWDTLITELLNKFQKPLPSRGSICRDTSSCCRGSCRVYVSPFQGSWQLLVSMSPETLLEQRGAGSSATRWCLDLSTSFRAITSFNIHSIFFHLSSRRNCLYIVMSLNHCTCASDKSWECEALEQHLQWRNWSEV